MKKLLLLLFCIILYGDDLKSLLIFASNNNKIIQSKIYSQIARKKEIQASKNLYYPTVDIGGFYQNLNARTPMRPGEIYNAYAKVEIDLYNGGRKKDIINQNIALFNSSKYDTFSYKKSLQLSIVRDYFTILSMKQSLNALNDKNTQLKAEVERIKKFFKVGSVTKESVDKLKAALSNNIYQIDAIKYQILTFKKLLSLKVGKSIGTLKAAYIQKPINIQKSLNDKIEALKQNAKSLEFGAKKIATAYKPQIKLEDTFNLYNYARDDLFHPKGLNHQNNLMLSFNIKIFDAGIISKQKESLLAEKMSIEKQISQLKNEQNINMELALSKIKTIKAQIKSAKSSLISANSTYKSISKKFDTGTVDNITFLDALSVKTNAKAQYEKALNDLQVAYATYYYYTNNNIKDFIK